MPIIPTVIATAVIEPITATPSTSSQTITASDGVTGYSPITVNAVDSSIDSNITAENIKNGVSILGVTGSLSAPTHYIEKSVDANGTLVNTSNIINLNGVTNIGRGVLYYQYQYTSFPANTNVDLSSLTTISGDSACYGTFYHCTGITSVNLSSLTTISGEKACNMMFSECSAISSINLSSLTTISKAYACEYMFSSCTGLTNVDISSLTNVTAGMALRNMFNGCNGITSVDISSLTTLSGNSVCEGMFYNCRNIPSIIFHSLTVNTSSSCFNMAFYECRSLSSLSFPSITPDSFGSNKSQFNSMFNYSVSGCTLHFPSNVQAKIETMSGYPNFGGTNTTVLFDLPATNTLTGANTNTYSRNPKYDTQTALAWKVGAYGTTDFTPAYYTSGTIDPAVGDTIYSDAACTTSVTTISTIA